MRFACGHMHAGSGIRVQNAYTCCILMLAETTELEQASAATDYKIIQRVGQGAFGEVCLIELSGCSLVALQCETYCWHILAGVESSASTLWPDTCPETGVQ